MLKHMKTLATIALFFAMAPQAMALDVEVAVGVWQQNLSGTLGFDELIDPEDVINLDNDVDFNPENRLFGRARFDLPLFFPNIYVAAAPMNFEGNGTKNSSFDFGDISDIPAGTSLDTEITLNQYDVALFWGIPALKTATAGVFNIDLGLNVRILDLEAKLHASDGDQFDQQEEASATAPVPMLFLAVHVKPTDAFGFEAEGRGVSIGDNKLFSFIGRVRYNFTGPVFLTGGYRYDKFEIDEDDVKADIEFSGPFVEMGIHF
jgi:outer membrane protein